MSDDDRVLDMWAIYDHPNDFPNHFVARRWICRPPYGEETPDCVLADTLDALRAALLLKNPGLYRLPRQPDDDPAIVEVWL